jgi:hypothetical protein
MSFMVCWQNPPLRLRQKPARGACRLLVYCLQIQILCTDNDEIHCLLMITPAMEDKKEE